MHGIHTHSHTRTEFTWPSAAAAATHCNTLQHTAPHCITLHRTATHCNTLQHSATHCNTLKRTATHCNTLQQTATHCNTYTLSHTHTHTHRRGLHDRVQLPLRLGSWSHILRIYKYVCTYMCMCVHSCVCGSRSDILRIYKCVYTYMCIPLGSWSRMDKCAYIYTYATRFVVTYSTYVYTCVYIFVFI